MTGSSNYYFAKLLTKTFIDSPFFLDTGMDATFSGIHTKDEFHQYLTFLFSSETITLNDDTSDFYVLDENLILGTFRMRQLRVMNGTCGVHHFFKNDVNNCHGTFSSANENKEPYGLKNGTA